MTQKIQLTIATKFISPKGDGEEHIIHSKSDNIEIIINDKGDEVIEELLNHFFLDINQNGFETPIKGNDFILDWVHFLYYKCHKINPNRGESQIALKILPSGQKNKKSNNNSDQ